MRAGAAVDSISQHPVRRAHVIAAAQWERGGGRAPWRRWGAERPRGGARAGAGGASRRPGKGRGREGGEGAARDPRPRDRK